MNSRFLTLLIMVSCLLFFVSCQHNPETPPPSSFVDRTMVDYSFVDITSSCQVYNNINITYYTENKSATPCISPKKETFIYYTELNNWSVMCCEYESKCLADSQNVTSYNNVCQDSNDGGYTGYVFNDNGFWMAQCCNANGGSCYVDLEINVTDDTTVCDEEYHQNAYSVDYNGTDWNAMCCIGGLEE